MAITQEQVVIGDFEGITTTERKRTTGAGTKSRITIEYRSQPLVGSLDPVAIGKGVAEAMARAITAGIKGIAQAASTATILKRKSAAASLSKGGDAGTWAKKRYSGGRTGLKPPMSAESGGGMLFNDSGRLAEGIFARPNRDGEWTINVAANRFDPSTFSGGASAVAAMITRLRALVPVLASAQALFDQPEVLRAAKQAAMFLQQRSSSRLAKAALELGRSVSELGEAVGEFSEEG